MNEAERLAAIEKIALDMYCAGMGDCYDALDRLTRPALNLAKFAALHMPEPTPYERGTLARYQDGYKKPQHKRARR